MKQPKVKQPKKMFKGYPGKMKTPGNVTVLKSKKPGNVTILKMKGIGDVEVPSAKVRKIKK